MTALELLEEQDRPERPMPPGSSVLFDSEAPRG